MACLALQGRLDDESFKATTTMCVFVCVFLSPITHHWPYCTGHSFLLYPFKMDREEKYLYFTFLDAQASQDEMIVTHGTTYRNQISLNDIKKVGTTTTTKTMTITMTMTTTTTVKTQKCEYGKNEKM